MLKSKNQNCSDEVKEDKGDRALRTNGKRERERVSDIGGKTRGKETTEKTKTYVNWTLE
jgi:hypothetical protein